MKYCSCGFPAPYGRFLEWTSDGTILGRDSARTRLAYLNVGEIQNILDGVSRWMGVPIDRIVYRAEKEVGRRFIKTMMPTIFVKAPRGRFTRPKFGVKAIGHFVFNYMAGLGMGRAEVMDYRSAQYARVRITDTHCLPLVAGDGAGVFEYLERIGVETTWERVRTDEYILDLVKESDEPPEVKRLALEDVQYIPGNVQLQKCERCGVPFEVSQTLYLNLEKGILRHSITGTRIVALPAQSWHAVFRELFREFGEEFPSTVVGLEQDYIRENVLVQPEPGAHGEDIVRHLLKEFAWRGIGNPTVARKTDRGLEVVVENPFHPEMVAGRVAGLVESLVGYRVQTSWFSESPGRLTVILVRKS